NSDVSNDGTKVVRSSSTPTVVKFFRTPQIGLAKYISSRLLKADSTYDVDYVLVMKNTGGLNLTDVTLADSMSDFTLPARYSVIRTPTVNSGSSLRPNPNYSGSPNANLLLQNSSLAIGKTDTIRFSINVTPGTRREIANQAVATGSAVLADGSTEIARDLSNAGSNPDAPGNVKTIFRPNPSSQDTLCIGGALSTIRKERQDDGSYNFTYQAIFRNCGNVTINNIILKDTLAATFPSSTNLTIPSDPTVSSGSGLTINPLYDGVTNLDILIPATSSIAPNRIDTVRWTVNIQTNGNTGPFSNNVTISGENPRDGAPIFDVSNNGTDPNPVGSTPTLISFDSTVSQFGLAKKLESTIDVDGKKSVFNLVFAFVVKNYSSDTLRRIDVKDNLAGIFGNDVIIDSVRLSVDSTSLLKIDSSFTGKGSLIDMLDSNSVLRPNSSDTIRMFLRLDRGTSKRDTIYNTAIGGGILNGNSEFDTSTDGYEPDADGDGDVEDDDVLTPIYFPTRVDTAFTPIGAAKGFDTLSRDDGSYEITYRIVLKNYGKVGFDSVQVIEDLENVFIAANAEWELIGKPELTNGNTNLVIDSTFDGIDNKNLLIQSLSFMDSAAVDTIKFVVKVQGNEVDSIVVSNQVEAMAYVKDTLYTDLSESGLNPDKDNDGNPGDNFNPTVIVLPALSPDSTAFELFIPGGLSPNGDGKNDQFILKSVNNTSEPREDDELKVHIYNRWGALIYFTENYALDAEKGIYWEGNVKSGMKLGKTAFVPDGTYYYVIQSKSKRINEGKRIVGFVTIKR
ncbi:MAG: gliding motility-associated C-terminal domain-containing protein, partial [Leadbetterella sp.]